MDDAKGLAIAFEEAKTSYGEGGIPVRDTDREQHHSTHTKPRGAPLLSYFKDARTRWGKRHGELTLNDV